MSKPRPSPTVAIVGRGAGSAQAALDLAQCGVEVTLLTAADGLTPAGDGPAGIPLLLATTNHPRIRVLTGATVEAVRGPGWQAGVKADPDRGPDLRLTVRQAPRYVDPERCTACGACAAICPVVLSAGNGRQAISRYDVPTAYAINKAGTAPCREACPIDQRAQGYVALIRAGDFEAAYRAIKRENPFPSVCGRVCNHRCEEACTRREIDAPVAVMALKRFVADWAAAQELRVPASIAPQTGLRVAVVGAGPAGLTAARELNRLGHRVTVLEALPVAGGMMRVGIPAFRLPRERLQQEIDEIVCEGVDLRTNNPVDDVDTLFAGGYDAVVLAVGLHVSRPLGVPGEVEPEGITDNGVSGAVEFLRAINLGERPDWRGRRVVVVGGGSTAMDTARVCRRLGAEVEVVYRRSRAEMPAHDFEVNDAQREGVTIRFLSNPARIVRERGQVVAVECVRMELGEPDESGRRRPVPVAGSEFTLPADTVLMAIGQTSDLSLLAADETTLARKGIVQHEAETLMTPRPGLFVAGDVAGTEGFVVDAIANGLQVARSVDRYLRGAQCVPEPVKQPVVQLSDGEVAGRLRGAAPAGTLRARAPSSVPEVLLGDFEETDHGLTEAEARAEAARCLNCGLCSECLACVQVCPAGAIDHQQAAQVFELQAGAAICVDAPNGTDWAQPAAPPGVLVVDNDGDPATAVEQVLAYLGVKRAVPAVPVAAPFRRHSATRATGQRPRIGVFLCRCGGEIERAVDLNAVAARIDGLPGLVYVDRVDFACHPGAPEAIREAIKAHQLDGAVLAACSCCALDQVCYSCTSQRIRCKERLGVWDALQGLPIQFANVREQCAFVHRDEPLAATAKAGDLVAAAVAALTCADGGWQIPGGPIPRLETRVPIMAVVNPIRCRGCEDCELACGLEAVRVVGNNGARLAQVDAARCLGCGVCMAACSSGAILASDISDVQAEAMLAAMGDLSDKTIVFCCNWGAYSALEAAGVGRLAYDPSVRLIRLMCAGRAHEGLILRCFSQGAARVLVLACGHDGDMSQCHYHTGNEQAARGVSQAQGLLALLGVDPGRLALVEMAPGDGAGFVAAVEAFVARQPR